MKLGNSVLKMNYFLLPWWSVDKNMPVNAGDMDFLVQEDSTCYGATKPVCH